MGDNVDSDLLYDEFDNNDRKEFDNVKKCFSVIYGLLSPFLSDLLSFQHADDHRESSFIHKITPNFNNR